MVRNVEKRVARDVVEVRRRRTKCVKKQKGDRRFGGEKNMLDRQTT